MTMHSQKRENENQPYLTVLFAFLGTFCHKCLLTVLKSAQNSEFFLKKKIALSDGPFSQF
jgi:hypothetical protein